MADDPFTLLESYANPQRERFWTPQHEQQFQQFMAMDPDVRAWRQAFQRKYGEPPNMNDPSFDYRTAWLAGDKPRAVFHDGVPHWSSYGKSPTHPTEWMNTFLQQFGANPTDPGAATPEQTKFLQDQLLKDTLPR